jgi:hypothetical protein
MNAATDTESAKVISAIDPVIAMCQECQATAPDPAVEQELNDLLQLRAEVERQWPLPDSTKAAIKIGPVAAKNIADWNSDLANALMALHHVLKHDGDAIAGLE